MEVSNDCSVSPCVTDHGLVVEGESLKLSEGIGGCRKLSEDHKRLTPHPHGLQSNDVHNLAELGEQGVKRPLQLCRKDRGEKKKVSQNCRFFAQIV